MPFGRGFGRGYGWGFGRWPYGGAYPGWGWGRGRGNPFPFCRNFPWLPRWWWAMPNAGQYAETLPDYGVGQPGTYAPMTKEQEINMLEEQRKMLENEFAQIKKRLAELQKSK